MLNVTGKWRWNSVERAAWAESLEARPCPECGWGELRYRPVGPWFNPTLTNPDRSKTGAVIFGRWSCSAYGQCELAPG